jgi:ADP-ribosylglycohydrolase
MTAPARNLERQIRMRVMSALWAAHADAVGFIAEHTDTRGLARRLAGRPFDRPLAWTRRVGGRFGVDVELPAGTYSDDTQLRLAVGRAIRPSGFDPEAFAKVELPVWTCYALGGGRATRAAAEHLTSHAVPWFANFHKGWADAGGNGAAMRIQPHVWAAPQPAALSDHLVDVLADAAITHGHPRALVGAVLYALALGETLDRRQVPGPQQWQQLLRRTHDAGRLIEEHPELSSVWLGGWNRETGQDWRVAWKATVDECHAMLDPATAYLDKTYEAVKAGDSDGHDAAYGQLADALELRSNERRGSGTGSVIAALAVAAACAHTPAECVRVSANLLHSDTDTIATMAAALAGSLTDQPPPGPILDEHYITTEAERLARISMHANSSTASFRYPDLLKWTPPKTPADAIGLVDGAPALAGIGQFDNGLTLVGQVRGFGWSWGRLDFGQTVLVKHRVKLGDLGASQRPPRGAATAAASDDEASAQLALLEQHDDAPGLSQNAPTPTPRSSTHRANRSDARALPPQPARPSKAGRLARDVDGILDWVRSRGFDDSAVGYAIRRLAEEGTLEQLTAFVTAVKYELHSGRPSTTDDRPR